MSRVVLLDAGPLGMIAHPRKNIQITLWLRGLIQAECTVAVPEIADYEVRRELLCLNALKGLARLDALKVELAYLPLTTQTMLQAAAYWAQARQSGKPTTDDRALDGDVILAAQATILADQGNDVVIATTNVGHLARFVAASEWADIVP